MAVRRRRTDRRGNDKRRITPEILERYDAALVGRCQMFRERRWIGCVNQ
jgi:hypothetical protein